MPTPALITVVLATYNWPQALDLCLQSLAQQQDKHFEVVIADDGSTSDTADLIARHQSHFPVPLQHVWQPDAGFRKAKILNQAIAATRGDYLVFLDGDCLVQPDFMTQHRRLAQVGVMVTGSRILLAPALTQTLCAAGVWDYAVFSRQAWRLRLQGQMNKCLPLKLKLPDLATRLYKKFVWSRAGATKTQTLSFAFSKPAWCANQAAGPPRSCTCGTQPPVKKVPPRMQPLCGPRFCKNASLDVSRDASGSANPIKAPILL